MAKNAMSSISATGIKGGMRFFHFHLDACSVLSKGDEEPALVQSHLLRFLHFIKGVSEQ